LTNKLKAPNIFGEAITVTSDDYISLTNTLKAKDGNFFIADWMGNCKTIAISKMQTLLQDSFVKRLEQKLL